MDKSFEGLEFAWASLLPIGISCKILYTPAFFLLSVRGENFKSAHTVNIAYFNKTKPNKQKSGPVCQLPGTAGPEWNLFLINLRCMSSMASWPFPVGSLLREVKPLSLSIALSLPVQQIWHSYPRVDHHSSSSALRLWLYCFRCRFPAVFSSSCCLSKAPPAAQVDVDIVSQNVATRRGPISNGAKAVDECPPPHPQWWPRPN